MITHRTACNGQGEEDSEVMYGEGREQTESHVFDFTHQALNNEKKTIKSYIY